MFLTILALEVATAACSGRNPNSPVSQERRSDVEYDIALDYLKKDQPRLALEHCRNAVELDDQNAKASYFASYLHLLFCNCGREQLGDPDCHLNED